MLRPSGGETWTRAEAATLLPVAKGVSISIAQGKSWCVKYQHRTVSPWDKKSETHSWGPFTGLTHREALVQCLHWVWGVHQEETGELPDFDLQAL